MSRIKAMVVDDSAVVRQMVTRLLDGHPDIELIATAMDPILAMEKMKTRWPDVILLDIEMPRMDGITFLKKLMAERPTPVVICSTLTEAGAQATMDALAAGAVSVMSKPQIGLQQYLDDSAHDLIAALQAAAQANVKRLATRRSELPTVPAKQSADAVLPAVTSVRPVPSSTGQLVAIGASTGGTQALQEVLSALPEAAPGIVIVQHMPEKFTAAFAQRLDQMCAIAVREAQHGDVLHPGLALIAPGGKHMLVRRRGVQYVVEVLDGPPVNRHRPSVDVLFRSVSQAAGRNALGIILTGMGDDGAAGLLEMRQAGARTLAQEEASCVVYGMPKEAVQRGAVMRSMSLHGLSQAIMRHSVGTPAKQP